MNCFQTYLKTNNISFEEYEEWFTGLKEGTPVRRNNYGERIFTINTTTKSHCKEVDGYKYTLDVKNKTITTPFLSNPHNFPILPRKTLWNSFDEYIKNIGITKEIYQTWFVEQKNVICLTDDTESLEIKRFGNLIICGPLYFKYDTKQETVVYSFDNLNYQAVTTHFPRIPEDTLFLLKKTYLAGKNESSELINSLQKQLDHYKTMLKIICDEEGELKR